VLHQHHPKMLLPDLTAVAIILFYPIAELCMPDDHSLLLLLRQLIAAVEAHTNYCKALRMVTELTWHGVW
jgi:hypothetical protein